MGVEGPTLITTFSLIVVAIGMSISVFAGSYFLKPSLNLQTVLSNVAYDISALYDVAYTLPGNVKLKYYGNGACTWNYAMESNTSNSFVCFSGDSNLIKNVYIAKEYLLVAKDPYMKYDFGSYANVLFLKRPAFFSVNIPFWDASLTDYNPNQGSFLYTSLAYSPFAASYSDIDMISNSNPEIAKVNDYSFVVEKNKVNSYYNSLKDLNNLSNPQDLKSYISFIDRILKSNLINEDTNNEEFYLPIDLETTPPTNEVSLTYQDYFIKLLAGYKFHIYDDDLICQERISLSKFFNKTEIPLYENSFDNENFKGKINNCKKLNNNPLTFYSQNLMNNFTISFWIKTTKEIGINKVSEGMNITNLSNQNYLISSNDNNKDYVGIDIGTNGIIIFVNKTDGNLTTTLVYKKYLNDWNNIVLVYNNKVPTLFINGRSVIEVKKENLPNSIMSNIFLGKIFNSNNSDIYIDELKIYDKSLDYEQIQAILINETSNYLNKKYGQGLNEYYIDYCFKLSNLVGENNNVKRIIFSDNFKDIINKKTKYCVSQISCIMPKLNYVDNKLILNATLAYFNPISGGCQNNKPLILSCNGGLE